MGGGRWEVVTVDVGKMQGIKYVVWGEGGERGREGGRGSNVRC